MTDAVQSDERPLSLSEVGRAVSPERPVSLQTVLRWCTSGITRRGDRQRVRLASYLVGRRRYVRPAALARFVAECNGPASPDAAPAASNAGEILARMGL